MSLSTSISFGNASAMLPLVCSLLLSQGLEEIPLAAPKAEAVDAGVVAAVPAAAAVPAIFVDAGTVQTAYVVEYDENATCKARIVDGRVCGVGRKVELGRIDKARAISLTNDNGKGLPKACATPSRYAIVFETTQGLFVVETNFTCHTIAGRAMTKTASAEVVSFLRLHGMVKGL